MKKKFMNGLKNFWGKVWNATRYAFKEACRAFASAFCERMFA